MRYLHFCLDFLVMQENGLINKIGLISKSPTLQPGYQTIAIHILTNISQGKDNQAMKPSQLIEHKLRNIFLEKPYPKRVGETISRPFSKKYLSISLDQYYKLLFKINLNILFLLLPKLRTMEIDCLLECKDKI